MKLDYETPSPNAPRPWRPGVRLLAHGVGILAVAFLFTNSRGSSFDNACPAVLMLVGTIVCVVGVVKFLMAKPPGERRR